MSNRDHFIFDLILDMSSLDESLDGGPGSPSHASSPVSSLEDFGEAKESGLGDEAGQSNWRPVQDERGEGGDGEDEEDDEEEIMEEFR